MYFFYRISLNVVKLSHFAFVDLIKIDNWCIGVLLPHRRSFPTISLIKKKEKKKKKNETRDSDTNNAM